MRLLFACVIAVAIMMSSSRRAHAAEEADRPAIDVVFCIDCSGSMGPVIETAKQKVWAIVNEIARAKPTPVLRIGLYGYGNGEGPFPRYELTDDLDEVYKNLMTFKDEGWGSEFVGLVVHRATEEMNWADGEQVLKVIYVVGNETAKQGPDEFDYTKTAPAAIAKEIIVNAIYCGDVDYQNATPTWRELARLADGKYLEIAAEGGAIVIATPFDEELAALNGRLNATYLAYGPRAAAGAANQVAQDANAAQLGTTVAAERAVAKSASLYRQAGWDLVDAMREEEFDLSKVEEDQLPEELKKLPADQREAYVQQKRSERQEVQKQIQEIAAKRSQFIADEIQKRGLSGDKAFDEAVKKSIVEQAERKGFEFEQN